MTGMKLYEAAEALQITDEWLEEQGGELTPELEAILEQAEGDFATKAERVALKVKALEAEAAAIGEEAERLAQRATARAKGAKSLKAYLQRVMEAAGKDKVNGLLVTIALQNNPPSVVVGEAFDAAALQEVYPDLITLIPARYELDKAAVKVAAKAGKSLPLGVSIAQGRSLRIR